MVFAGLTFFSKDSQTFHNFFTPQRDILIFIIIKYRDNWLKIEFCLSWAKFVFFFNSREVCLPWASNTICKALGLQCPLLTWDCYPYIEYLCHQQIKKKWGFSEHSWISLIEIRKSSGPKTAPCGTPKKIFFSGEIKNNLNLSCLCKTKTIYL